ncbi:hypothetical protein [Tahibacter harae]|uniref:Uncharacterized protein n=1 Tax=Tahibacter harae TaxID=2963937 RepID=A0ABT1QXX9_9GAMM|nr:hypothetical protein [Tahibacter harae]MCQ4167133.1 hypothetical protein [Tahibacter harae]
MNRANRAGTLQGRVPAAAYGLPKACGALSHALARMPLRPGMIAPYPVHDEVA